MKKIAVCIPTYNEADMIEITVKKIERGLSQYMFKYKTYIVNCDNNSSDGTREIFENIKTESKKIYIGSMEVGKGINLINFFKFCNEKKIDYAITLDADVISMESIWIEKFLNELITEKANYIVPIYKRSRFEGSTTNQFAYPLIYALTGKKIRQPIGGDFAFDKHYIKYILQQTYNEAIKRYGIDIFMTLNAIYGGFSIKSIELGKKIHKPSFSKMYNMFDEVLRGAMYTVIKQGTCFRKNENGDNKEIINLISSRKYVHKKNANDLLEISFNNLSQKDSKVLHRLGYRGKRKITDDEWVDIMYNLLENLINCTEIEDSQIKDFVDLFIIRAVSYWNEVENISAVNSEKKIINVAESLRKKMLKRGGKIDVKN